MNTAREIASSALQAHDVPRADADMVADALVETSLRGIETHGLRLLPQFLNELDQGVAKPHPAITVARSRGAAVTLDADAALGVVAGMAAATAAERLARKYGVGLVCVRNSNHFGAASVYSRRLSAAGLIGIVMTSAAARVAPFNGVEPLFGTNPISVAAGGEWGEFVLDMATSQVCFGAIKALGRDGGRLTTGWATDAAGKPTLAPDNAHALSPLGGYKGQGIAMAVTLLTAVLAGAPLDWELEHIGESTPGNGRQVAHFVLCVDPDALGGGAAFKAGLSSLLNTTRQAVPAGKEPVMVPGDPERISRDRHLRLGIPLDPTTTSALEALAERLGIEFAPGLPSGRAERVRR
ncbi:Ldh family oxidoreductase [Actinomadura sp. B10D3]|uniref:Ldh family oxidoreductase n=1 Tax=Actinomadura sp. B10D3 TaxID=3153557 RepID=UPI00325E9AFF